MYQILLDQWEGNLDIDDGLIKASGVAGVMSRINSTSGGHHMDGSFLKAWADSRIFDVRCPYFVYNPYVDGLANFNWLFPRIPGDAPKRIMIDIEILKAGYLPSSYAYQVSFLISKLQDAGYWPAIYSGLWFLGNLSPWPKVEYWWARYPYAVYPGSLTQITWDLLKQKVNALSWDPDPYKKSPGLVKLWQCSGDKYILPGTAGKPMDINLWQGSLADLKTWFGVSGAPAPSNWWDGLTLEERVLQLCKANPNLVVSKDPS